MTVLWRQAGHACRAERGAGARAAAPHADQSNASDRCENCDRGFGDHPRSRRRVESTIPTLVLRTAAAGSGACRVCVVQVEAGAAGVELHGTIAATGMVVLTDTDKVRKMRHSTSS